MIEMYGVRVEIKRSKKKVMKYKPSLSKHQIEFESSGKQARNCYQTRNLTIDVVKCKGPRSAMVQSPYSVNGVLCVPVVARRSRPLVHHWLIDQMLAGPKRHIPFSSDFVLGVICMYAHLFQAFCYQKVLAGFVVVLLAVWQRVHDQRFQGRLEGRRRNAKS